MARPLTTDLAYRPHLDGLRAIAVVLVIAFHAGFGWTVAGFIGVDVFFVLSGYLITLLLVRELRDKGGVSLRRFYARRARRLLPASILLLVAVALASLVLIDAADRASVAGDVRGAAIYFANWHFVSAGGDYFAPGDVASPLVHYWSLAVEEQFYLVWPALLLGLWWVGRRREQAVLALTVVATAALAVLSLWLTSSAAGYYGTHTRAYQLLAGAVLAMVVLQRERKREGRVRRSGTALVLGGVAVLVWLSHVVPGSTGYPGRWGLAVTVATLAVLIGLELFPAGVGQRLLGAPPLAAIGRLSYSLYLWHWPVLVFAPIAARDRGWEWLANRPLQLVLTAALATGSYLLLERPVRFRLWPRAPQLAVVATGLALSAITAGIALPLLGPRGDQAELALNAVKDLARAVNDCPYFEDEWPAPEESRPCTVRGGGARTVALVGDSHAQMWAPTLEALARRDGFTFVTLTRGGCPANDVVVYHLDEEGRTEPDTDCAAWRAKAYSRLIVDYDPDVVIVSTRSYVLGIRDSDRDVSPRDPDHVRLWTEGLSRSATTLAAGGATVLVSEILPTLPQRVPACLAEHNGRSDACTFAATRDTRRAPYNDAIRALQRDIAGVRAFDPESIVCPDKRCPARRGKIIVHRDDNHITATFARSVADEFAALLERASPSIWA
jgi:peptidoglycan/LPS O-acetylase OafA/YrhL